MALNNIQWLICHKTKQSQILYIQYIRIEDFVLNKLHG